MVDSETVLVPDLRHVAAEVIEGEAVIINVATGIYYSADGTGGWAWERLGEGRTLGVIAADVAGHFEVDPAEAPRDLAAFGAELLAEGLVVVSASEASADAGGAAAGPPSPRRAYAPPRLNAFRDMKDLLALDPPMPSLDPKGWNPEPALAATAAERDR